jgi:hypothetical protein
MSDVFRQEYTPLTDEQKAAVLAFKQKAQELYDLLPCDAENGKMKSREFSIAATTLEEAVMWAVKGLTA